MNIRPPWIEHAEWVDSVAEWGVNNPPKQDDTLALLNEVWPLPAEACSEIGAEPNLTGFPLEPYFCRHTWLGPLMVALVAFIWLCLDGYMGSMP